MGAINYIVAAIWGFRAYRESSPSDQVLYAIWSGSALGTCYFVAFFFLIYAVHWVGASNSAAVSRLSLVIPVAAGILLWGEHLNGYQSMGIVVAFVSLFLVGHSSRRTQTSEPKNDQGKSQNEMTALLPTKNAPSDQGPWWLIWFVLLTFFVICGCSRLTQQACNQMCDSAKDYPTFLFAAFVAAGIPSLCVLIFRRNPISRWELLDGNFSMGTCRWSLTWIIEYLSKPLYPSKFRRLSRQQRICVYGNQYRWIGVNDGCCRSVDERTNQLAKRDRHRIGICLHIPVANVYTKLIFKSLCSDLV